MNKELRVFVLSADVVETSAYDIEQWLNSEELPQQAKDFIDLAEENASVYTLLGFQNALNLNEIYFDNSWIFITDKY